MDMSRPSPPKEGWTNVSTNLSLGQPPSQRSLHAAAILDDSMYVFGGYDGLNRVNDFYEFHFPSKIWREIITVTGAVPLGAGGGVGGGANELPEGTAAGGGGGRQQQQQQAAVDATNAAGGAAGADSRLRRGGAAAVHHHGATIAATGRAPTPRDRHAAVVHRSSLYVFGGFDGTSRVSDLYAYDADRLAWREVRPQQQFAEDDEDDIANNPFARAAAAAVAANNNNGGGNDDTARRPPQQQQPDREVFGHEGEAEPRAGRHQHQHQNHQQPHSPPTPRHSHAAVVYGDCMYVFGGYDGSYRSDFHEFDFDRSRWQPVLSSGRSPRARYRSTACVRGDVMILFGGHDGTRHLADVHLFDFVNRTWSLLVAKGVPPLPRDSHISVSYKESMYVFGGSTGSAMNDLYELNFESTSSESVQAGALSENGHQHRAGNGPEDGGGPSAVSREAVATTVKWRQIPLVSGGVAVHRFCHVGAVYKGSLYVFGGYDGSSRLNDFVKYDLAADNLFETEIPPSTLLSDLRSFLDDEDIMSFADVTLMVEGIPVRAHKLILMRCPYFRAMFLGEMAESSQAVVNIEIVRHSIFKTILEYLYTDTVVIPLESAMELFVAADCLSIPRLQAMCEQKLLESLTVENAATILLTADAHRAVSLRDKVLSYILLHFEAVSKTAAFEDMARSNVELVFEILKSR